VVSVSTGLGIQGAGGLRVFPAIRSRLGRPRNLSGKEEERVAGAGQGRPAALLDSCTERSAMTAPALISDLFALVCEAVHTETAKARAQPAEVIPKTERLSRPVC